MYPTRACAFSADIVICELWFIILFTDFWQINTFYFVVVFFISLKVFCIVKREVREKLKITKIPRNGVLKEQRHSLARGIIKRGFGKARDVIFLHRWNFFELEEQI